MSDIESHRSQSLTRDIIRNVSTTDDHLNDHRNQPASLPIRVSAPDDTGDDENAADTEDAGPAHAGSSSSSGSPTERNPTAGSSEREGRSKEKSRDTHAQSLDSQDPLHQPSSQDQSGGRHHRGNAAGSSFSNPNSPLSGQSSTPYPTGTSRGNVDIPQPVTSKSAFSGSLRTDFYLREDDDQDAGSHIPFAGRFGSRSGGGNRSMSSPTTRLPQPSASLTNQYYNQPQSYSGTTRQSPAAAGGILMNASTSSNHNNASVNINTRKAAKVASKARRGSFLTPTDNLDSDIVSPLTKSKTNDSAFSDNGGHRRERRTSRSSIDSDQDSRASRSSQETEEDVCFPMLREHVKVNGIDFDEIEEFIKAEREEENFMKIQQSMIAQSAAMRVQALSTGVNNNSKRQAASSNTALKYTPKNILKRTTSELQKIRSNIQGEILPHDEDERKKRQSYKQTFQEKSNSDSSTVNEEDSEKAGVHSKKKPDHHLNDNYVMADVDDYVDYDNATNPEGADFDDSSSGNVKFGGTRINDASSSLPDRFSFFSSESDETVHSPDIPSLVGEGQSVRELFKNGESTWWLDCGCPTDAEMKMIAKAFGIHPLTAEDIRMQETREKVELFRNYYFVCFHTFEPDRESEDYLEPINIYIVVLREGMLTFHFSPVQHPANVRRRVRQLRDYVDVSADWLCYALIDDITDGFAPVITGIEYEADAIEDSVFVARELDFSNMLQRIGESRRKVMTLMRLLSGKADVIRMFAKRCQDEFAQSLPMQPQFGGISTPSNTNLSGMDSMAGSGGHHNYGPHRSHQPPPFQSSQHGHQQPQGQPAQHPYQGHHQHQHIAQPRADIALYLGDIQDHVVTMFQNLVAYEKIFSRSHANYLAQLQVESFNSNNKVTEMLSKVTLLGTMLIPLNVITGLFGMNVHVPGEGVGGYGWFFGIIGVMVFLVTVSLLVANIWLKRIVDTTPRPASGSSRRSIKSLGLRRNTAKSILSFPNKYE